MTQNTYGTTISFRNQTTAHAQVVIDTAITVWMQMGLTQDQILYGIAMMNVESGYQPVITNGIAKYSIRGLGQFNTATWNATARSFDAQYQLPQAPPVPYIKNASFNPQQPEGTNAQAGSSNDGAAGVYDPDGLVSQLEVVGKGIQKEWAAATSSNEVSAALRLAALGGKDAPLFNPDSAASSPLIATVALAYLNHHEGGGWWSSGLTDKGITYFQQTVNNIADPGLASAIQRVVTGVENEISWINSNVANPTYTASDLLVGDPWVDAGAQPSKSDTTDPTVVTITHDIPSIFPTIDDFFSDTAGGLTSYVENPAVTHGSGSKLTTDAVSYTFSSAGTQAADIVSGSASFSFDTDTGAGTQVFGNGDTLTYTLNSTVDYYHLQSSETDPSGSLIYTMTDNESVLAGIASISQVFGNGSAITGGQLGYINVMTETETEGVYDNQGRLIEGIASSSSLLTPFVQIISTSDQDYADEAAALAQEFDVPITDADVVNAGGSSQAVYSSTAVDNQGNSTTSSTTGDTSGTASADPGFRADALQKNGNTLQWSFNADGTVASRDIADKYGDLSSLDFDSAGNYTGTSTTTVSSDGSIIVQTYDAHGNSTGYKTTTPYGAGTAITINGVTTTYSNGCTVTTQYGPTGTSGSVLEFSISSTVQNADGSYTTTEVTYQPVTSSDGSSTNVLVGSTVTQVNGDNVTSTDYDANGNVLDSRSMVTSSHGTTIVEQFNASGTLVSSTTMSMDNQGDVTLQSFNSSGTLTDSKEFSSSGVLTDTQYQNGSVSQIATSSTTPDGGNVTTYKDLAGNVTGDQWVLSDGSYGSDTVAAGGSIDGASHFSDSTSSTSVNDGSGHITTTNYSASGVVTGTTTIVAQGGSLISQFVAASGAARASATVNSDGSMQAGVTQSNGATVGVSVDASDDVSWTSNSGGGTTTAVLLDSDGNLTGTSVTTTASDGSVTTTDFDTTNTETGYSQTIVSNGVTTTTQYTDTDATFMESGYTQSVTNSDGSVTATGYSVENGVSTETQYSNTVVSADGISTTTTYELNSLGAFVDAGSVVVSSDEQGHVTKAEYDGNGVLSGYTLERTDSAGDVLIAQYDSAGTELRSTTIESSGVVIDDVLQGMNGDVTTMWQADGSFQQTTNDGEGDITTVDYAAGGSPVSDTWTQGDGSAGEDTVNADGSVDSISNDGEGNLTTTTTSASGEVTSVTDYYDHAPLTAVTDTKNSSWGLLGAISVVTSADGLTTTTSNYNSSDQLLGSQTRVVSDGGSTVTTSNFDGSGVLLNSNIAVTSSDGLTVTTSNYDGSGNLLGTTTDLTSADGLTVTESDYDASGNLLNSQTEVTSSDGSTVTTSNYNSSGQLQGSTVAVTSSDGYTVTTSTYDASGDLLGSSVAVTSADGLTTTTNNYNAANQGTGESIAQTSEGGTATSTYMYDARGELTSDQIAFTDGVEPGNLKISTTFIEGIPALVIDGPTDSITVPGGLLGSVAAVTSVTFGVGVTMSLDKLIQHAAALGNVQATTVQGASGNWIFDPESGDSLTGGSGSDTLLAWGNNETVTAGAAGNVVYAQGDDDVIDGGSGNDALEAFGAADTLVGGSGNDLFVVGDSTDVVSAGTGLDSLVSSVTYRLPVNVDEMTLTGGGDLTAYGNDDSANTITGNSGNDQLIAGNGSDTLISGVGIDTLVGDQGTDTFVVNNSDDVIELPYGGSNDTVNSSVNYVLTQAVGTFALTGSADLTAADDYGHATLTGNSGQDTLIGGSGSDTLVAGSGADLLITGTGTNTLVVNNADDSIVASSGAHEDTLISSVSESLLGGVDTLELTGRGDLTGQGNSDATNQLTANDGDDELVAGSGADTLTAGTGQDTLIAGSGTDLLDGRAGKNETFVLDPGFGTTTLLMASQSSMIQFGQGISAADLTVSTVVDSYGNLALQISDGNSVVTIDDGTNRGLNAFNLPTEGLTFEFADGGGQYNLGQLLAAAQVTNSTVSGANGDLVLKGALGAVMTEGGTGDDTLLGASGGQFLLAGSGNNQVIYGFGSREDLVGGTGGDTLYGLGSDDTLAGGSGNTVMYAGGSDNYYTLTDGTTLTINPDGETGPQTLILPEGMTADDFTSYALGNDLYLASGSTSVLIKGYFSDPDAGNWVLTDSTGNGQLLSQWIASTQSSGGGSLSTYQTTITELQLVYSADMASTLKSLGENDETIVDPADPRDPDYYTDGGVTVDPITVSSAGSEGGPTDVDLPTSDNDDWQDVTTSTGTETETFTEPVYQYVTHPAESFFVPVNSESFIGDPNYTSIAQFNSRGQLTGYEVYESAFSGWEQTGTQTITETIPVSTYYTTDTQSFTFYNVTGQGSNLNISANGPFVGTVDTGDGNNVNVQLGLYSDYWFSRFWNNTYNSDTILVPGAFIDVGNGLDDSIRGSVGVDTIVAGLGVDTIEANWGSTVYVPMEGASIDTINIVNPPFYGSGPFPHNTLVLPDGVTPGDLQFKLFAGLPSNTNGFGSFGQIPEALQVTYGDSTLLLEFDAGPPSWYLNGATSDDTDGINYFQFADGTTLTRAQVLAMAGAAITPDDTYNPVITQSTFDAVANSTESATNLFTSSDASGSTISVYRFVNDATDGAYFTLGGQTYTMGAEFDVAADQLSQLQLVTGDGGSGAETFVVSGFDGWTWGQTTDVNLNVTPPDVSQATEADLTVQGTSTGQDTLSSGSVGYDSSGNELNDNIYTPGTDGSYSDQWRKPDGSSGSYWWNSSTSQYGEGWTDANGTSWTDNYQYATGGSPGGTGASFTETYSDSAGDQGTRQYDASTGVTAVTWYSASTGTITGTVTDSGFIGLQNNGELTNTQPDLTFFNPTASPAFQNFLSGH